jgi:benzoylformate decarboxylase
VVDEEPLLIGSLGPQALRLGHDHYYFAHEGGLGWGVPAAVGLGLARPGASVLCVTGNGSTMVSSQALRNAARRDLTIVFVVLQNGEFGIVEPAMRTDCYDNASQNTFFGPDINQPAIDFVAMGKSFGIRTLSLEGTDDVAAKVADAFRQQGPTIIVIPVNG